MGLDTHPAVKTLTDAGADEALAVAVVEVAREASSSGTDRGAKAYGILKLIIEGSALILLCFGSWYAWQNLQVLEQQLQDSREARQLEQQNAWQNLQVLEQQLQDSREARQLEQRPWVTYSGYEWEVYRDDEWTSTDRLQAGERFRVRLSASNAGGSPAIDVLYTGRGTDRPIGLPPAIPEWTLPPVGSVPREQLPEGTFIMPDAEPSPSQVIGPFEGLTGQDFEAFKLREQVLFFRSRIEYCDVIGKFHWTEVGIRRYYGEIATRFQLDRQRISPAVGTENHPHRCEVPD